MIIYGPCMIIYGQYMIIYEPYTMRYGRMFNELEGGGPGGEATR